MFEYPPEVKFILNAGRTQLAMPLLPLNSDERLDWEQLVSLASRHGMCPLVYHHIRHADRRFPASIQQCLHDATLHRTKRNLWMASELLRIAKRMAANGVPILAHKGPALAVAYYGQLNHREFWDLDIAVRVSDARTAMHILVEMGYHPAIKLSRANQRAFLRQTSELTFEHPQTGMIVELQWRFMPIHFNFQLTPDECWPRLRSVAIGNESVTTLDNDDQLLVLCAHGAKHMWERMSWVLDIALVATHLSATDWDDLVRRADALRCRRILDLGLILIESLFGVPLPPPAIQDRKMGVSLLQPIIAQWGRETPPATGIIRYCQFQLQIREAVGDRCRSLFAAAVPGERDWGAVALPPMMTPLYWLIRPIRLAFNDRWRQPAPASERNPANIQQR